MPTPTRSMDRRAISIMPGKRKSLLQVTGAADWHINSDESDVLDYDTSFKPASRKRCTKRTPIAPLTTTRWWSDSRPTRLPL